MISKSWFCWHLLNPVLLWFHRVFIIFQEMIHWIINIYSLNIYCILKVLTSSKARSWVFTESKRPSNQWEFVIGADIIFLSWSWSRELDKIWNHLKYSPGLLNKFQSSGGKIGNFLMQSKVTSDLKILSRVNSSDSLSSCDIFCPVLNISWHKTLFI